MGIGKPRALGWTVLLHDFEKIKERIKNLLVGHIYDEGWNNGNDGNDVRCDVKVDVPPMFLS